MSFLARAGYLLALAAALPTAAASQDARTFQSVDGSYTFNYPLNFALDREFADGTGDVTGVTASSPANGDVIITFLGPRDLGDFKEVSEKTRQEITDAFTKAIANLPLIKLKSSSMTKMLGQPAIDMVFQNARMPFGKERPQIKRYVFTIANAKAYNFECIYREDKAAEFAPACDLAVSTVQLAAAAAANMLPTDEDDKDAPAAGSCTKLELNRRAMQVTDLTSDMLMKDQSPAMVARVRKAHDAAMAIDERAGQNPSTQDCMDVDTIIATLK
ncbi:hypothetical protein [Labrys sp. (in: a-proteobacteria)]|uniref:hypothetical protein n=1 Tax=Labrys sp. (in: a-proteobacteria) TaxID=1917972 RepID=UPI0039E2CC8D